MTGKPSEVDVDKALQLALAESLCPAEKKEKKEKDDIDGFLIMMRNSLKKLPYNVRSGLCVKLLNFVNEQVTRQANLVQQVNMVKQTNKVQQVNTEQQK